MNSGAGVSQSTDAAAAAATQNEIIRLGILTRPELETLSAEWITDQVEARPDLEAAADLVAALPGAEITVFLGTWCADSRRQLSRLWRALDDAGVYDSEQIRYIGIDRQKREPSEWIGDTRILLVPTFVVARDGVELGRIVETAPNGIERDLAALLRGEESGVLTGSSEALAAAAGEP